MMFLHKLNNPGRPIVSGINTVTEKISSLVDSLIKDIPPTFSSYIKDTNHFLKEITQLHISAGSFLVTLDVTSLYTNIPHDEGILAVAEAYKEDFHKFGIDAPTLSILTKLVLELNNFEFEGRHFLQINGTAMGTKMAPNYANIFMSHLESRFLAKQQIKP